MTNLRTDPHTHGNAFPVDTTLPQLTIASDADVMREMFRTHLRPLHGKSYEIQECRLSRVRYRRGARCVLQYTLRLLEPRTGHRRSLWVTGVVYEGDRAERIWHKLEATAPSKEIPERYLIFEPVSFIPELKMLVEVFPYDRRLPTLPLLMGPSLDVQRAIINQFGSGNEHLKAWKVEPVRYRAELGAVVKYSVRSQGHVTSLGEVRHFFAKVYPDEAGRRTYHLLQILWAKADRDKSLFTVGRPIAYLDDLRILVQEESTGTSLQQHLIEGNLTLAAVRKAAIALVALHLDHMTATRRHRPEDELIAVRRAGDLVHWACPHLSADVEAIVGAVTAGPEEVPMAPTHGDLKARHILLDGNRLALLDLDGFAEADPVIDPATLLAHFAALRLSFAIPLKRVQNAAQAFAEEYFTHVPADWLRRLPLVYAAAALKEAVGFFRRQEPHWPDKVAALVGQARDSLAGKIW